MIDKLIGIYNAKGSVVGEIQYFFVSYLVKHTVHSEILLMDHSSKN